MTVSSEKDEVVVINEDIQLNMVASTSGTPSKQESKKPRRDVVSRVPKFQQPGSLPTTNKVTIANLLTKMHDENAFCNVKNYGKGKIL